MPFENPSSPIPHEKYIMLPNKNVQYRSEAIFLPQPPLRLSCVPALEELFHLLVLWLHQPTLMIIGRLGHANCHFDGWSEYSLLAAWGRQTYPFISLGGVLGWSQHKDFSSSAHSATYQLLGDSGQVLAPLWASVLSSVKCLRDHMFEKILSLTWGFSALCFLSCVNLDIFFIFLTIVHRPVTAGKTTNHSL